MREGYRKMDAYAPFPVEGLSEAIGFHANRVALLGAPRRDFRRVGGYLLQYYAMAVSYPLNVGGRPMNSWPMFVPVTFEATILCASLSAVFGMLALNGCR